MSCRRLWIAVALVLAVAAGSVQAQSRRRRRRRKKVPIRLWAMQNLDGELYLRSRLVRDKQAGGNVTTRQSELTFEEGLDLDATGYVYHPNLLSWDIGFKVGSRQERLKIDREKSSGDGLVLGYDVTALLLKEKPLSFRAFAKQRQDHRDRGFTQSAEVREDRYGAEALVKGDFPASFLAEWIVIDENSDVRQVDRESTHMRLKIRDARDRDWETKLLYEHLDKNETSRFTPLTGGTISQQDVPDTRDELTITNRWRFGPGKDKHSLDGRARALERIGSFDNRALSAEQELELIHDKTFSTFYSGNYDLDETESRRDRTITGEAGFTKEIYRSLVLKGRGIFTDRDFSDGRDRAYGGLFDARYRKRTGIGRYECRVKLGREYRRQESEGGQQFFRNERVTLKVLDFSALKNVNVDLATVVVTNANGAATPDTIAYVENIDYELRVTGATTEIARLPGSAIKAGDVVLVDYAAQIARDAEFTTDRAEWSQRLRLKDVPISLYTDLRLRDENLTSGQDPGNLDRRRSAKAGAEYRHQGVTVSIEHEVRDQDLSPPTVATRARARVRKYLNRDVRVSLSARAERLDYKHADRFGLDPGSDFSEILGARAGLTAKLGRKTLIKLKSGASRNRGRNERTLFKNEASLEWKYGKLDLSIKARYNWLEQDQTERDSVTVMFVIKREF